MVAGTMSDRRRRLLSLFVASCLVTLTGLTVDAAPTSTRHADAAAITAVKAPSLVSQSTLDSRPIRHLARTLASLPVAHAGAAIAFLAFVGILGLGRRIHDVESGWRSLLLGAPPAATSI